LDVTFPLTPALSLGERENHLASSVVQTVLGHSIRCPNLLTLPKGKNRCEGERDTSIGRRIRDEHQIHFGWQRQT